MSAAFRQRKPEQIEKLEEQVRDYQQLNEVSRPSRQRIP